LSYTRPTFIWRTHLNDSHMYDCHLYDNVRISDRDLASVGCNKTSAIRLQVSPDRQKIDHSVVLLNIFRF